MATIRRKDGTVEDVGESYGEFQARKKKEVAERREEERKKRDKKRAEIVIKELERNKIITEVQAEEFRKGTPVYEGKKLIGFEIVKQKVIQQQQEEQAGKTETTIGIQDTEKQQSRKPTRYEELAGRALLEEQKKKSSMMSVEKSPPTSLEQLAQNNTKEIIFFEIEPKTGQIKNALSLEVQEIKQQPEEKPKAVLEAYKGENQNIIKSELQSYGKEFLKGFTLQQQDIRKSGAEQFETLIYGSELNQYQKGARDVAYTTGVVSAIGVEGVAKGASKTLAFTGKYISKIPIIGKPIIDLTSAAGTKVLNILSKPSVQTQLGLIAAGDIALTTAKEGSLEGVRKTANIAKDVVLFSETAKGLKQESLTGYKKTLENQLIVKEVKVPELIRRDISVDIYGRPFQTIKGVSIEAVTPKGTIRQSEISIGLGEPEIITPQRINYIQLAGQRQTDIFIGQRADIRGKSRLLIRPAELTTPTGQRITTQTPYEQYYKRGYFESILQNEANSVRIIGDDITITNIRPAENIISLRQKGIGGKTSDTNILNVEQFEADIRGLNIEGKPFTTDIEPYRTPKGKKTTVEINPEGITGKAQDILTGKEIKTYSFGEGQTGSQLYIFDRADILLNKYGTRTNPVAEFYTKPIYTYSDLGAVIDKPINKINEFKKPDTMTTKNEGGTVLNNDGTAQILKPANTKTITTEIQETETGQEGKSKKEQETETRTEQRQEQDEKAYQKTRQELEKDFGQTQTTKTGQDFRFIPITGVSSIYDQLQEQGQKSRQRQKPDQINSQLQEIDILQDQILAQDFKQIEEQITRQTERPARINEGLRRFRDFLEPVPLLPSINLNLKEPEPITTLFNVQVGKKENKLFFEGKGLNLREAIEFGRSRVKGSAAASFRITPAQTTDKNYMQEIRRSLGQEFRPSKIDEDVFVQRREYRISSIGEKEDITFKGLASLRRKDLKKLF